MLRRPHNVLKAFRPVSMHNERKATLNLKHNHIPLTHALSQRCENWGRHRYSMQHIFLFPRLCSQRAVRQKKRKKCVPCVLPAVRKHCMQHSNPQRGSSRFFEIQEGVVSPYLKAAGDRQPLRCEVCYMYGIGASTFL